MDQITSFFKKHPTAIILTVFILVGTVLRLKLLNSDIWYDESFTILTISKSWQEMFLVIKEDLAHPPLYYILAKIWGSIINYSPTSIRSLSIVFGVATIPLSYITSKQLHNKTSGIIASTLFTFSPFFITYSVEARSYSILAFLTLLTLYFYHKKSKLFYLILLLLILTHYFSILVIISFFLLKFISYFKISYKDFALLALLTFCIIFIFSIILPYTDIAPFIANQTKDAWIKSSNYSDIIKSIASFLFGVDRQAQGNPPLLLFNSLFSPINLAFLAFCFLIFSLPKTGKDNTLFMLYILAFLPIIVLFTPSLFGINVYVDRYAITSGSFLLILFSYLVADFKHWKIVLSAYVLTTFLIVWPDPISKYSQLANVLETSDKIVVYEDPQDYTVMQFYLPGKKDQFVLLANEDVLNKNALVPKEACIDYKEMILLPSYLFIRSGVK